MGELISAKEGVSRLVKIQGTNVDLSKVLSLGIRPDHAHWAERVLPNGETFDPGKDLNHWLHRDGLIPFALAKVAVATGKRQPKAASHFLFSSYFADNGIYGEIKVSGNGLLDYRTGARINFGETGPDLDSDRTVKILPEVDNKAGFDAPDAPSQIREIVRTCMYIFLNANMISGSEYSTHLDGRPTSVTINPESPVPGPIITGDEYLERIDEVLDLLGYKLGIEGIVMTERSKRMIEVYESARIPR